MSVELVHSNLRAFHDALLPSSCQLRTVNDTTGARTTIATVACGTMDPTANEQTMWLADDRGTVIELPYDALDGLAEPDLIVVDSATAYRVRAIQPKTSLAAGRRVVCVESREPSGPV